MAATAKNPEIIDLARGLNGTPWCEEYENMISGMMLVAPHSTPLDAHQQELIYRYDPTVPKLLEARHRCRALMADHNLVDPRSVSYDKIGEVRLEVLKKALGRVGEGTFVEPPFLPDYGCNIVIGKNCFVNWKYAISIWIPPSLPSDIERSDE